MKITATEARKLAGPTFKEIVGPMGQSFDQIVDEVYQMIEKAASNHKRQIDLRSNFWTIGGQNNIPEWHSVVKLLKNDGYDVFFFETGPMCSEMRTIVKW